MARLSLRLFGPPRLELDGAPVETDRRKALALLAYLAVTRQDHSRDALAALFWPDYDRSRAYAYLRRALWEIHQAVGEGWVSADRETLGLNPDADLWLDVAYFRALLAECRQHGRACAACLPLLTEAAALYQDHFLAGFSLKDAPDFDEWVFFEAEGLRRELGGALERLVSCLSEQGDAKGAIAPARRWLALDPLNEAAHRELMQVYDQAGQHAAALRQYQECMRTLQAELGATPQPETTALYERIKAGGGRGPQISGVPAAPDVSTPPRHNLPPQTTPFIGRAEELARIAALLSDPDCRLLTLTGPGGAGKTRIALQAAQTQLATFSNGVYFVPLAPIDDPASLVAAIADAVGFSFFSQATGDEQSMQQRQLLNFLSQKHLLLVLDNFEQLLPAAGLLVDILQAAPRVKILVTSRERLSLQDEWVLSIGGMHVPATPDIPEGVEAYSAVQLFVHNARRAVVGFSLSEAERPFAVRICQLVEGLPLGLELAAAWVKTLSCREIAEEIEHSLDFLTTPLRDVPARHHSLRAVFEYSWRLLTPPQQTAFRRLSVFSGGFDRAAALAVAGATLPILTALVDKSLLYHRETGRYELHEVLRQYAAEKLRETPDEEVDTLTRHSAYYGDFTRARQALLFGREQKRALEEIGAEIENIRAGWRRAVAHRDAAGVDEYLEGLFWFYEMRSRFQEAEELSGQALAILKQKSDLTEADTTVLAQLLAWRGHFCYRVGRLAQADDHMREGLTHLRRLGKRADRASALVNLLALTWHGLGTATNEAEARRMARENMAYYRAQSNGWGMAQMLLEYAWGAQRDGDLARAKQLFHEALQLQRDAGDNLGAARALNWLGEVHHHSGEYAEARQCYQASLDLARQLGDQWAMSLSLDFAGYVARRMGDHAEARRLHEESLASSREIGDQLGVAGSLDNLGLVAYDAGDHAEAERLFQEALKLRREAGSAASVDISLEHIASAALARGDTTRAEQALYESLALERDLSFYANRLAHLRLADLRRVQGQVDEAREQYRQTLHFALQRHELPLALESLTGLAALRAQAGDATGAVELVAFVLNQPASDYATRSKARRLLEEVSAGLPPQALAEAEQRGRAGQLEALTAKA